MPSRCRGPPRLRAPPLAHAADGAATGQWPGKSGGGAETHTRKNGIHGDRPADSANLFGKWCSQVIADSARNIVYNIISYNKHSIYVMSFISFEQGHPTALAHFPYLSFV